MLVNIFFLLPKCYSNLTEVDLNNYKSRLYIITSFKINNRLMFNHPLNLNKPYKYTYYKTMPFSHLILPIITFC